MPPRGKIAGLAALLMTQLTLLSLLSLLAVSAQPAYAEERSYRIEQVDIQAVVDANGDMQITERDIYRFDGAFNGIVFNLNESGSDGIEQFRAYELAGDERASLKVEASGDGDRLQYKVYAPAKDTTKTFEATYKVKNAVQVYADTAELYWKFFDADNEHILEAVTIEVKLPDGIDREQVQAFAHGPAQGTYEVQADGSVLLRMNPLPAAALLETRILFPPAAVPLSRKLSDKAMLDTIVQEEHDRSAAASDRGRSGDDTVPYALLLLLANLAAGTFIYLRFSRRFRSDWRGRYFRELPADLPPAYVGYLMRRRIGPGELVATLVDLVHKKYIEMDESAADKRAAKTRTVTAMERDYVFRLSDGNRNGLLPHEAALIDWLFPKPGSGKKGAVSISRIRELAAQSKKFHERWTSWREETEKAASGLQFFEPRRKVYRWLLLAFLAQFFGLWFLAPEEWRWLMFCAVPLLFFKPTHRRRTPHGQTEYMKWKAFRQFLLASSRPSAPEPLPASLREQYLAYAIPLGAAKKMKTGSRLALAEPGGKHSAGSLIFDDYLIWSTALHTAVTTAPPSGSSSDVSDSGGFFSSGGGDGGGGGGRGAF